MSYKTYQSDRLVLEALAFAWKTNKSLVMQQH